MNAGTSVPNLIIQLHLPYQLAFFRPAHSWTGQKISRSLVGVKLRAQENIAYGSKTNPSSLGQVVLLIVRSRPGEIILKMKKLLITLLGSILLISACGPEPVPTMSAEDVQGTAVAAAWTMVAETQAAIPTNTPVPPTETPSPTALPTNTTVPLVVATLPLAAEPTATTASSVDECNKLLQSSAAGPTAPIKIINETKAPINLSLFLNKTVFGECGYRSYSVPRNGSNKYRVSSRCHLRLCLDP